MTKGNRQGSFRQSTIDVFALITRGFESHLGLRFFLCPLMVDFLHLPLFPL